MHMSIERFIITKKADPITFEAVAKASPGLEIQLS